ncbi:MAG: hypothetical protein IIY33_08305 [Erysipelotrichaceae bacterium]|nr:hypothetical protein [Erysipelotrichaceae bacterium]
MWKSDAFVANSSKRLNKDFSVIESVKKDSEKKADELWSKIRHGMSPCVWNWDIVFSDKIKTKEYPLKHYVTKCRPNDNNEPIWVDLPENKDWIDTCDTKYDQTSNIIMSIILGEYNPRNDRITLYINAIKSICNGLNNFQEIIDFVLVHEVFHAVHYYILKNHPKIRGNHHCREIVMESLASFYEYEYCNRKGYNWRSKELSRTWHNYSYGDWPYAGARVFLNQNNNNYVLSDKFMDVLEHSCISWEFACGEIRGNDKYWDSYPSSKL